MHTATFMVRHEQQHNQPLAIASLAKSSATAVKLTLVFLLVWWAVLSMPITASPCTHRSALMMWKVEAMSGQCRLTMSLCRAGRWAGTGGRLISTLEAPCWLKLADHGPGFCNPYATALHPNTRGAYL